MILLVKLITKENVRKIAQVILSCYAIIILPPILDLILSGGKGYYMTYLFPGIHNDLLQRLVTFGGNFSGEGITPGMRIEGLIIFIASFFLFSF